MLGILGNKKACQLENLLPVRKLNKKLKFVNIKKTNQDQKKNCKKKIKNNNIIKQLDDK